MIGITREAGRSITATGSIGEKARAAYTTVPKEGRSLSAATTQPLAAMPSLVVGAALVPVPQEATAGLVAAMPSLAIRAILAPAPSAVSAMAERNEASRRAEAPASVVAAAVFTAVEDTAERSTIESVAVRFSHSKRENCMMRRPKPNFEKLHLADLLRIAALATLLFTCLAVDTAAQQKGQKTFSSPQEASKAMLAALQNNDEPALLVILGPDARQIVSSGDPTEDAENHANFVRKYEQMHRFMKEPDGSVTLYIGAENWPTPIPLVAKGNVWFFDTEMGKREILFRRIGRNEYSAIRIGHELVAAEKEYYATQHNEYAPQIYSDEGQHNGLYWKVTEGEPQSPIGPLVASAVAEGYAKGNAGPPTPYRGYFFHILTRQGKDVSGGAKSYLVNGKMTEGFAFVAYPAEYRSSGVMTFIVNQDGVVYQKDLGKKTAAVGKAMQEYNPDSTWTRAEDEPAQTSSMQRPR